MESETTTQDPRSPIRKGVIQVVARMIDLLEPLSDEDRSLAMRMVAEMAALPLAPNAAVRGLARPASPLAPTSTEAASRPVAGGSDVLATIGECNHLGDFFALCGPPDSAPEAVLVAAAFLQAKDPNPEGGFGTRQLNAELKHLGRPVANASATLDRLMERRPTPVTVVRKAGNTRQAHKSFKVTHAGYEVVARMLAGGSA